MLDLFSGGGGGWCLAARFLGLPSVGIEWDGPSCSTRAVVGLPTIRADVSTYPAEVFAGRVEGICGGPPCQSFSSAGKGKGLDDPRGQMVYEPMRYVRAIRPRWVALEQVPEVLGYWRWIAQELVAMGYSTWAGVLNAADYGVPQIRRRAILLASLDRLVRPPAPTHSRHGAPGLFGDHLPKWITMAEALGWDGVGVVTGDQTNSNSPRWRTDRPSRVVSTHGNRWKLQTGANSMVTGRGPEDIRPYERDIDRPAPTVDTKAAGAWKLHNAAVWCWERPATTIPATHQPGSGRGMVAAPGHHTTGTYTEEKGAIPVEQWELGVLQGFPADHPWQPPRVSAQIGNAIPPPLAEACLRTVAA